jgi:hypothetical protein
MDTTYFGRKLGLMVFKDSITGSILFKQYVKQETNILYLNGIEEITRRGIKIQSIICDGRKGLFQLFRNDIPIQMCNFHQVGGNGHLLGSKRLQTLLYQTHVLYRPYFI